MTEHVDVLIVGAGLSGICAGYYLQTYCPQRSYTILEGRSAMGGTWDLFRYPGIRSDSDMHTLGYSFRPWGNAKAIADGPAILSYIQETAVTYGIDQHIRYNHRVLEANWSTKDGRWTVSATNTETGAAVTLTCNFLYTCSGYYDYAQGHAPTWPGMDTFQGPIIHPQQWPEELDYAGKRVVVIGSGATAVTLVPAMADEVEHITMLQRSPTFIVSRPNEDKLVDWINDTFPEKTAHKLARWKFIFEGMYYYQIARHFPDLARKTMLDQVQAELGEDYDVQTHFNPRYNPWDQRVCLVPDSDLFKAMNAGKASIVTDEIDRFTDTGILLKSGEELTADIIITATGLKVNLHTNIKLVVDDQPVNMGETLSYRGTMMSGVPNMASAFGYTNASWTLKCELISEYVCRLLNYMDEHGYVECLPQLNADNMATEPGINLNSGYIQRAIDSLPRQGEQAPWRVHQNYLLDVFNFRYSKLDDGTMMYRRQNEVVPTFAEAENVWVA